MRLNIEVIEKRRRQLGITKTELARKSSISKQLLYHYYKNPQCLNNAGPLADALGLSWRSIILKD